LPSAGRSADGEEPPAAPQAPDAPARPLRIAVLAFPYLANFTDFDALAAEPSVCLAYLDRPQDLDHADLLILPGSKQTLDDLAWLGRSGFAPAIRAFAARSGVIGICGGMQMLGRTIEDPTGAESAGTPRHEPGLGLLPIATTLLAEKITRLARGRARSSTLYDQPLTAPEFEGYEIHLGETIYLDGAEPFAEIRRSGETNSHPDGAVQGNVFGTYIHGLFAGDAFRHSFLAATRAALGLVPAHDFTPVTAAREARIDRLAAHVRAALDMNLIRNCIAQTTHA
jgi:adenosylcobyric acid synthase